MAVIYLFGTDEAAKLPADYGSTHFPRRRERAESFRFLQDKLLCIGAGALLYAVLGIQEENITLGEHGKPEAAGLPCEFNLSHSGSYAALAVGKQPVGVDIEQTDERHLSVAKRVLTAEEQRWMAGAPAERFSALWTMKESVCKALGRGLSLELSSFSALPLLRGESITVAGETLFGQTLPLRGYGLSLCTVGAREEAAVTILSAKDMLHRDFFMPF